MTFTSILFEDAQDDEGTSHLVQPEFFGDLNLDQIIESVTVGKGDYDLKPFFYVPLTDTRAISYRHEIMHDLDRPDVLAAISAFADQMRVMRAALAAAEKLYYRWQKERWFLDGVKTYCDALLSLVQDLGKVQPNSRGLSAFREYLGKYCSGEYFRTLKIEEARIRADLAAVRYSILIKGNSITVRTFEGEVDYTEDVQKTFEKFKQGEAKSHSTDIADYPDMNHVEAKVLEFVAQLHSNVFGPFDTYCRSNAGFLDPVIARFDREIQFYVAYLEYISRLKGTGLSFCYPLVSRESKDVCSEEGFDLALAEKLRREKGRVVCNDFYLEGDERIIVVTGPNQGGKTTFARTFGQLHYLACIGWPVPGRAAKLFLFDQIFTHFEREEDMKNLRGKLHDDLYRIHHILGRATTNSIVIMNEIFSSTSLKDALFLSRKVMGRIMDLDALSVYVTFIEELSSLSPQTISMLSEVERDAVSSRTFKVVRRPADGRSYAMSLARQYRLTFDQLTERVGS